MPLVTAGRVERPPPLTWCQPPLSLATFSDVSLQILVYETFSCALVTNLKGHQGKIRQDTLRQRYFRGCMNDSVPYMRRTVCDACKSCMLGLVLRWNLEVAGAFLCSNIVQKIKYHTSHMYIPNSQTH